MLRTLPLVFVLAGVVLYVALAGADFGAGLWLLLSGRGERGTRIREHAHRSMAPVWEANHVWLIFVLTVTWTAYPSFFGSVASTLGAALLLAALGIVLRGASYALRAGTDGRRGRWAIDSAFAIASLVAPFALGAAAGAIASERVPVGNAAGRLFASWLNPTSAAVGVLAVVFAAYLAAVYLAADAARLGDAELETAFQRRALVTGALAGAVALGTLAVLRGDARSLYDELLRGGALATMVLSGVAGVGTLGLVRARRFGVARLTAALAVAAVITGWALARYPTLLPGLSVEQAAASHDTLVTLIVAVVAGGVLLFPSLGLLFGMLLSGRFDTGGLPANAPARARALPAGSRIGAGRGAVALLLAGVGLLNVAGAPWAHGIGVTALLAAVVLGFASIVPAVLAEDPPRG